MIEHYQSKLFRFVPKFFEGITIGKHVFYRSTTPPLWLRHHEAVHVEQFKKYGLFGYFVRYVYGWVSNGFHYHKIPLEVEAYKVSSPEN